MSTLTNLPKAIKLIRPGDIRKLHNFPTSYEDLSKAIHSLFPFENFEVTYNTSHKLTNTNDLQSAYSWSCSLSLPSLRLYITKSSSEHCDSCKSILSSPIYSCLDCNIYLCHSCESKSAHFHPIIKAKTVQELKNSAFPVFNPEKFMQQVNKFEKKMMKVKVISHVISKDFTAKPGQIVKAGWKLQNCGSIDWPEGSGLFWRSGALKTLNFFIDPVKSGCFSDIFFSLACPETQGVHCGQWDLVVRGIVLSKLKVKFQVI